MMDKAPFREVVLPQFISVFISEEKQKYSPERISDMVDAMLSDPRNNKSYSKSFRDLLDENSDPEAIQSLQTMAVIHHSSLRDVCIQYSKDRRFGSHEAAIHNFGEIVDMYRQLTNN